MFNLLRSSDRRASEQPVTPLPPLLDYELDLIAAADTACAQDPDAALQALRRLGVEGFAEVLWSLPDPRWPNLSDALPAAPAADDQVLWTGTSGAALLAQSVDAVRILLGAHARFGRVPLSEARVLDFGCGYGRLLRLLLSAFDPDQLKGCDPMEDSIARCKAAGIPSEVELIRLLPESLPYAEGQFDLAMAFSVFTHTSQRATLAAMKTLRPVMADGGLLVATIRPFEYWAQSPYAAAQKATAEAAHNEGGFAFMPHLEQKPYDGDVTYGDTSMTAEVLSGIAPGWEIVGEDRSGRDRYQRFVHLRAV